MSRLSRRLQSVDASFALALLLGLLALTARPATDPDLWWHLRTGQWMVENRQIPHTDPFSFTRSGAPWVSHEWLSELIFYELWRYAGWAGLIIVSAVVTTAGFMLLFWRCAAPVHWAAAATTLGALASSPAWGVRPQMFTFMLASLWLWLLERSEQRPWLLVWIPAVFPLWLNLHAGFALGPALLIAYGAGLIWEALTGELEWQVARTYTWRLLLILAACIALVPLNPSGSQLYRYPLDVVRSAMMRSFIVEWHSPDFHHALYVPLLVVMLALLVVFACSPVRPRARILLPLVGTMLAALDAVRHIPILILFAVPVIASGLSTRPPLWPLLAKKPAPSPFRFVTGLVMVALAIFAGAHWATLVRNQSSNESQSFPAKALDRLASTPSSNRVFAYYDWGGYVTWKLYPRWRVFVDGRADLYGDELLQEFQTIMQLRPGWRERLDSWNPDAVLVPASSALAQGLSLDAGWQGEFRDSQAVLFFRNRQTQSNTREFGGLIRAMEPQQPQVWGKE